MLPKAEDKTKPFLFLFYYFLNNPVCDLVGFTAREMYISHVFSSVN